MKSLRKNFSIIAILVSLAFSFTGCVYLIVGGIGALGGYVVSPDTVEGVTSHDSDSLWDAAFNVVSVMGTMSEQRKDGGVIIAKISGAKVIVTIIPLEKNACKLNGKARKGFLPKISVAQDVFVKIMSHLSE